ncbi:MAG: peptidoglycan-binding protein [Clostridia bacterium]|nr:peptidoglycan-binding protein [Clostridia bacterium]
MQSAAGGSQSPGYPEPTRVLRLGSTGSDVKWVQAALKKIGYAISVDGIFGTGTQNCVLAFQRSAGLAADGIVGPATRKALKARI